MKTHDEQRIESAVKLLASCHSRSLPQPAVDRWIRKLAPFAQRPALYLVLEDACDRPKMPACSEIVSDVLEAISKQNAKDGGTWKGAIPPRPTPEQQQKNDRAMIMSTLWLMYEKRWTMADVTARLGTLLGANPEEVIRSAMDRNTRESVQWWMDQQQGA